MVSFKKNCNFVFMCKEILITGVAVKQQMIKARKILKNEVIPREKTFQKRKKNCSLSTELMRALKSNA